MGEDKRKIEELKREVSDLKREIKFVKQDLMKYINEIFDILKDKK